MVTQQDLLETLAGDFQQEGARTTPSGAPTAAPCLDGLIPPPPN